MGACFQFFPSCFELERLALGSGLMASSFNSFLAASRVLCERGLIVRSRPLSPPFQFFPSCFTNFLFLRLNTAAPLEEPSFQFFPSCFPPRQRSPPRCRRSPSFQFFPSCFACPVGDVYPNRQLRFQFFPSCFGPSRSWGWT